MVFSGRGSSGGESVRHMLPKRNSPLSPETINSPLPHSPTSHPPTHSPLPTQPPTNLEPHYRHTHSPHPSANRVFIISIELKYLKCCAVSSFVDIRIQVFHLYLYIYIYIFLGPRSSGQVSFFFPDIRQDRQPSPREPGRRGTCLFVIDMYIDT